MAVDITDPEQVTQLVNEIESSENRDRRQFEWRSYEMYSGDQRKHILDQLRTLFPLTWDTMRVSNINILKKVVDKIAKSYKKPPQRMVVDDGLGTTSENEEVNRIFLGFNETFKQMDKSFNRHKCTLLWVQNDPEMTTEFDLRSLDPYLFDLVINTDTLELEAVILSYPDQTITNFSANTDESKIKTPDGRNQAIAESQQDSSPLKDRKIYSMWTKEHHAIVAVSKKELQDIQGMTKLVTQVDFIKDENNPQMINPLGMLPFAWLSKEPDRPEFPISSSLPFESININVLNSDLLTASAKQGFGQLVLKFQKGSEIKRLHQGFDITLELPQPDDPDAPATTAEFINANPDLTGMKEVMVEYSASVLSDEGLEGSTLTDKGKTFSSGLERLLASASVTEVREENQQSFTVAERKVFDIIKKYDEINKTGMFKKDSELVVHFEKPSILQSEKEMLDIIKEKLGLGLIQKFEALMILNSTLSESDAKEKLEQIKEEREENAKRFMEGLSGNQQEGERQED